MDRLASTFGSDSETLLMRLANGQPRLARGFEQVVHSRSKFAQLFLPEELEHVRRVLPETRVLVQEAAFGILTLGDGHLSWVILTKATARKEVRKAHDIEISLPIVECILLDVDQLVLVNVRRGGLL